MEIRKIQLFWAIVVVAVATGCTAPTACPANAVTAISVSVRSAASGEDVTRATTVDVTRNGAPVPPSEVQYPDAASSTTGPILVYGTGGNYSVVVHHSGYRDATVTANVVDAQCGPAQPPIKLIVSLTAL